jgi:hypothetical protein
MLCRLKARAFTENAQNMSIYILLHIILCKKSSLNDFPLLNFLKKHSLSLTILFRVAKEQLSDFIVMPTYMFTKQ